MNYRSKGTPAFRSWQEKTLQRIIQNPPRELELLSPQALASAAQAAKDSMEWPDQECPPDHLALRDKIRRAFDENYSQFLALGVMLLEVKEKVGSFEALWEWLPKHAPAIPIEDARIAVELALSEG